MCVTYAALLNFSETLCSWEAETLSTWQNKGEHDGPTGGQCAVSGIPSTAKLAAVPAITLPVNPSWCGLPAVDCEFLEGVYLLRFSSGP